MGKDDDPNEQLWPYKPNKTIPVIAAGVFIACLVVHLFIAFRKHAFRFMWAFCAGVFMEAAGYVFRKRSADHPVGSKYEHDYSAQSIAIVVAPALLAASCYQMYGRVVRFVGPELSPIKATRVTKIFVFSDVGSFIIQFVGAGMLTAKSHTTQKIAKFVLIGGFMIQILCFCTFVIVSMIFRSRAARGDLPKHSWPRALYTLWVFAILVLVRSVYRLAEYITASGGSSDKPPSGPLLDNEMIYWLLETLPTALSVIVMAVSHPSFHIPTNPNAQLVETYATLPTQQAYPVSNYGPQTYPPQHHNQEYPTNGYYQSGGGGYSQADYGPPNKQGYSKMGSEV